MASLLARTACPLIILILFSGINVLHGCGFDKCHDLIEDGINVHMVSHSHDDVGWVKTVNQYYNDQVRSILDTVVDALIANKERKFIQVETAFFYLWWRRQTKQRKDQVRFLIQSGQLEIAGGAWSMNDEATAHYQSIIDQFTLGLRFINDTLGPCAAPKVGWQVDPFGHSRQMATLFAEMGYKALFFGRLDFRDKNDRMLNKTMELIWRGNQVLGNKSNIFTSVLFNLYQPPDGFCFDNVCGYWIDPQNEETKVRQFINYIEQMANAYASNNILITMGGDFTYTMAEVYFRNIDFLINSIRRRHLRTSDNRKINIFYSTPACYYNAVQSSIKMNYLLLKTDDFFPYADKHNSYWTGFFTSRPTSKRYEREGNNLLQVSKQLAVLSHVGSNRDLFDLSSAMGIMQHHDAITGTEKQFVAEDYARTLHEGMQMAIAENSKRIETLQGANWSRDLVTCTLANMSICSTGRHKRFAVILYNPLGYSVSHHVQLPVINHKYTIRKSISEKVPYQLRVPSREYHHNQHGNSLPYDLTFFAKNIPALGMKQYLITVDDQVEPSFLTPVEPEDNLELGTKELGVIVNANCEIIAVFNTQTSMLFQQKLMYYNTKLVQSKFDGRPSGAYIFAAEGPAEDFSSMTCTIRKGPIYDEIRQEYESWASQTIRIYKDEKKYLEFDWIVGPIEKYRFQGREIISRFRTDLDSGDLFRTDTNGRSFILRKRNYRETYRFDSDDDISSNYYPITSYIGIEDVVKNKFLTIFSDRSEGATSLASGEVEIMLHRRLVQDDALGVEEVLDEVDPFMGGIARGQHVIDFGFIENRDDESISRELLLKPWPFLVPVAINDMNAWKVISKDFFGLTRELPKDIHLLSFEPWKKWEDKILIRLEHINEIGRTTEIDIKTLFTTFRILNIQETNLGANKWIDEENIPEHLDTSQYEDFAMFQITLRPLQIRTFVLTIKYYAHK